MSEKFRGIQYPDGSRLAATVALPRSHGKTTWPDTVASLLSEIRRAALEEAIVLCERRVEVHARELELIGRMPESERRSWLGSAAECHRRMAEWLADDIRTLLGEQVRDAINAALDRHFRGEE